eukprot:3467056-Pyramimonas_sp.AAC.1
MRWDLELEVRPYYDLLKHEIFADPSTERDMRKRIGSQTWPPAYTDHTVVRESPAGTLVIPVGVFIDAARYGG